MNIEVLVLEYGFEVVVIALISILMVGLLKIAFKSKLEKIEKSTRKAVYEIASMVAVVLLTGGWFLIGGGSIGQEFLAKLLAAYGVMKVMYPLYENFKIRDLVQLIGKLISERKNKVGE